MSPANDWRPQVRHTMPIATAGHPAAFDSSSIPVNAVRLSQPIMTLARQWLVFDAHPAPAQSTFRAWSLENYDGDTISCLLDAGDRIVRPSDVRLLGVNCPELHTGRAASRKRGEAARLFTNARVMMPDGSPRALLLQQVAQDPSDKYGRVLAQVMYYGDDSTWHDLAAELIAAGMGVPYSGGTR